MDGQFIPRDGDTQTGYAHLVGTVTNASALRLVVDLSREGAAWQRVVDVPLANALAPFDVQAPIPSELATYALRVSLVLASGETEVLLVDDLVVGDTFFINGQSNAVAQMYEGSANAYQHPFLRSFGYRGDDGDGPFISSNLVWNAAEGDIRYGFGAVGQWGLVMGQKLLASQQRPICVINGARGGRPMSYFQRNDSDPLDLSTNYGHTLLRLQASGLAQHLRGIFWYQGESDRGNWAEHIGGFEELVDDWQADLSFTNLYVVQLREGCGVTRFDTELRDRQRRLPEQWPFARVMTVNGLDGHDGCHYAFTNGYETLGLWMADLVRSTHYGTPFASPVAAPSVEQVQIDPTDDTRLLVRLKDPAQSVTFEATATNDFQLENGPAIVSGAAVSGGFQLQLASSLEENTYLLYTGHIQTNGGWVLNQRGLGLLAFRESVCLHDEIELPLPPTNLYRACLSGGQLELGWDEACHTESYLIERNGTLVPGGVSVSWWLDTDLAPYEVATYRVAAVNQSGTSSWSAAFSFRCAEYDVFEQVCEARDYELIYQLDMPSDMNLGTNPVSTYLVDQSGANFGAFDRVAYFMELQAGPGTPLRWVFVGLDPVTDQLRQLGIPDAAGGAMFAQPVTNLSVETAAGLELDVGSGVDAGYIEFWSQNYGVANGPGWPVGNSTQYDAADTRSAAGSYGSMQIHNGSGVTLFAYNRWGTVGQDDLGIGPNPNGHPDWTFSSSAAAYTIRRLSVLARFDVDADGLPDAWERRWIGDLSSGPADDSDGDGLDELAEYHAQTDPMDAASSMALDVARIDASLGRVSFQAAPFVSYELQSCTNLLQGSWQPVWTRPPSAPGMPVELTLPTSTKHFLRLRAEPAK